MPREAIARGAVDAEAPLQHIPERLLALARAGARPRTGPRG